jgi:hypothetical protein
MRVRRSRQMPQEFVSARKLSSLDLRKTPEPGGIIRAAQKTKTTTMSDI